MSNKKNKKSTKPALNPLLKKGAFHPRWIYIFLFCFAILLYLNTLNHSFTFDDSVVITGNKYTKQGIAGIKTLATKDLFYGIYGNALNLEGGRWRPFTLVMFAIEYQFFGDNASPYHAVNIFLYGITAVVLYITLITILNIQLGNDIRSKEKGMLFAFIATLIFIAHPIHTEAIANIKSRDEIISFLFLCLSVLFLFRYVKENKKSLLLIGVVSYFGALLSKENGITFIAIIPLLLFLFSKKNVKEIFFLTLPYVFMAALYLAIRTSLVGMVGDRVTDSVTDNPFLEINFPDLPTPIPFSDKLATVLWILLKYILLLIFPHPLTSDYGFNQIAIVSFSSPKAIASVVIYTGLIVYSLRFLYTEFKKRNAGELIYSFPFFKTLIVFAILYHVITISIVSNLFFLIGTSMGERFIYVTSLGFCVVLAVLFIRLFKLDKISIHQPSSLTKLYPLLLIILPYSYKVIDRNKDWKSNTALFTADVKTSTNSANAHYYYANTVFTEHLNDVQTPKRDSVFMEAKREFKKAIEINPYFHYCYYNIGLIWEKLGVPDSAIVYQQKTINLKPANTMAQYMAKGALGLVYGKLKGDFNNAIPLLKEALANQPENMGYHENLGICYAMKGDLDNSIYEFEYALNIKMKSGEKLQKEDARLLMNLALSFQGKGDKNKAENCFNQAFQLDPSLKK